MMLIVEGQYLCQMFEGSIEMMLVVWGLVDFVLIIRGGGGGGGSCSSNTISNVKDLGT